MTLDEVKKKIEIMEVQAKAWVDRHDLEAKMRLEVLEKTLDNRNQELVNTIKASIPCNSHDTDIKNNKHALSRIQLYILCAMIALFLKMLFY